MTMTSSRPYLIRALYDWIVENDCTPYILINAYEEGVEVPQEHVKDGQIILNISPIAVQDIHLANDCVGFEGRFAGIPKKVLVPMSAILGIYARENGQGMIFDAELTPPDSPKPGGGDKPSGGRRPGSGIQTASQDRWQEDVLATGKIGAISSENPRLLAPACEKFSPIQLM